MKVASIPAAVWALLALCALYGSTHDLWLSVALYLGLISLNVAARSVAKAHAEANRAGTAAGRAASPRAAVLDALASGCRRAEDVADETGLRRPDVDAALAWLVGRGTVEAAAADVSEVGRGRPRRSYRVVGLAGLTGPERERLDRELAESARRARRLTRRRRYGSFPGLGN